ncbi:MAG: redoxin family protein [Tannerella sp.]|jgi:thiol-disulfide isomerase/thioredoxin|nr:redoxin family protein [Tannerella sp.]
MKQILFTAAVFLLFLFSSCNQTKETVITGQIVGNADKMIFSNPSQGTCFTGFRDTIFVDESGKFELRFNLKQPAFIALWNPREQKFFRLLLESGSRHHILIDMESGIEISGTNEAGQRLLATLPNPPWIEMEAGSFMGESSLTVIRERIQNLKEEDLRKFGQLLDENKISASFYELIGRDRSVYYASLEAIISQMKMFPYLMYNSFGEDERFREEYLRFRNPLENQRTIYAQLPPDNENLLLSSFWFEYAKHFIQNFVQFSKEDFDVLEMMELFGGNSDAVLTFFINEAREHLTGKSLEFFQATFLFETAIQREFEKSLIAAFEQFKSDFPRSEYSRYIQPLIDEVVAFHNAELNENIIFIENTENINTLAELIEPLKGRKIYIGIWATWCGPCIDQFSYSEAMREILKENDIQMLYISIDNENVHQHWQTMIRHFDLQGKHIRANESLNNDLRDDSRGIRIPWYILVDEEGNIVQMHAKRPSQVVETGSIF